MLEVGKNIGNYVLVKKIGAGGFGEVWQAEKHTKLSVNNFALKFFRPKEEDKQTLEKEKREIGIWQKVSGMPNIISIIEADEFEDYVYIVSEFADGGSLEKKIFEKTDKKFSLEESLNISLDILTGLDSLHQMSFVHRDVKPANILIRRGVYCLTDFGISREMKTHSKTTQTAGTYEYMSPESFENSIAVTFQTDIWAVGAIMQQLLTGDVPFPQKEIPSLLYAILHSEPTKLPDDIPEGIRQIIGKALSKNPQDRFASAKDMLKALKYRQMTLFTNQNSSLTTQQPFRSSNSERTLKMPAASNPELSKPSFSSNERSAQISKNENLRSQASGYESSELPTIADNFSGGFNQAPQLVSENKNKTSPIFWILGGVFAFLLLTGGIVAALIYKMSDASQHTVPANTVSNTNQNKNTTTTANIALPAGANTETKTTANVETDMESNSAPSGGNGVPEQIKTSDVKPKLNPAPTVKTTPDVVRTTKPVYTPKEKTTAPVSETKKQDSQKKSVKSDKNDSDCIFTNSCN